MVGEMRLVQARPVRRPVLVGLIVVCAALGSYFVWSVSQSEFRGSSSMQRISAEFSSVPPPRKTAWASELRESSKFIVQTVSADFRASLSATEVVRHYETALTARGWRRVSAANDSSNAARVAKFCKEDLDAVLEFTVMEPDQSRYYFGVRWEGGPRQRTGCVNGHQAPSNAPPSMSVSK